MTFVDKVAKFLKDRPGERFTARQIAEWIFENASDGNTPVQQLARNVASAQFHGGLGRRNIKITDDSIRKFYFTEFTDDEEVAEAESQEDSSETKLTEHDLYPILSQFLWLELKIYSKRIDETRSTNSHGPGGNKWLYPDLVGLENLSSDWHEEIKSCVNESAYKKGKLWSFEVKKLINRSNVREAFFQAVSNSSWANFGYLVAGEINADASKELRMLANLHGLGFIRLNDEDPSESKIMIPAKERSEVNWDVANRLATENPDFLEYIKLIREFYHGTRIRPADWEEVEDDD